MIIGVSTSAYQIEGNNFNTDWYYFEKLGLLPKCGSACNFWEDYPKFIELMKKFNIKAHRMSIEWSRIYPKKNKIDEAAIRRYKRIIELHRKNGIEVFLTIWHFTNPIWFFRLGGWEYRENIDYFLEYVKLISKNFDVKYWITINEPIIYFFTAYVIGIWPPFKREGRIKRLVRETLLGRGKILKNFVMAHEEAYKILKEDDPNRIVGYTMNFLRMKYIPMIEEYYSNITLKYSSSITDFYGVNYYGTVPLRGVFKQRTLLPSPNKLEFVLKKIRKKFRRIPIIITENGIPTENELERAKYILNHFYEVYRLKEKYRIIGYFYWSFCDNYEWEVGYGPKFGLFTRNLEPKLSAYIYRDLIKWIEQNE